VMRVAQLVLGPAGAGKSTYCQTMQRFGVDIGRDIRVVNLDPAATSVPYPLHKDVRDLTTVDLHMGDTTHDFGPNGALVFAMRHLLDQIGYFMKMLELKEDGDEYILFDCPGQIELCTHLDIMERFSKHLAARGFAVCAVFLLEPSHALDSSRLLSASLAATAAFMALQVPFMGLVTKVDALPAGVREELEAVLETEAEDLLQEEADTFFGRKFHKLTTAMAEVLMEPSFGSFLAFDRSDAGEVKAVLDLIDNSVNYEEEES